jgi:hypothetical protein
LAATILIIIAVGVVALILGGGLYTLWAGGEVSRRYSNKLMRMRVIAQFVAIVVIMLVLALSGR